MITSVRLGKFAKPYDKFFVCEGAIVFAAQLTNKRNDSRITLNVAYGI